jgi:uncharacterized protein YodC (DUF2158 family)
MQSLEVKRTETFELGEIVVLSSGGPTMTVIGLTPDGMVTVVWISRGRTRFGSFPASLLRCAPARLAGSRHGGSSGPD